MTICSRALHTGSDNFYSFGATTFDYDFKHIPLKILKASKDTEFNSLKDYSILIPVSSSESGFNSMVFADGLFIYTQILEMEIYRSSDVSPSTIRANTISSITKHYFDNNNFDLEKVHVVFYEWGSTTDEIHSEVINEIVTKLTCKNDRWSAEANKFVKRYQDHIHIVNQGKIRNWILPSFLPIAYLSTIDSFE
jgi:hypothetical protein